LKILKRHKSKREIVRDKIQGLVPSLTERFGDSVSGLKHAWQGDDMEFSFRALGFQVKGTVTVSDSDVHLDLRLPFAAKMFEGRIRSAIETELDKLLPEK
jgi:putative polyhydroxyalkanoate system protein